MMSKKFVKVMCIFLAALMVLSVVAVLTQVFAVSAVPNTGVDDINPVFLIVGAALCMLIIILCIALPKLKKKESSSAEDITDKSKGENNNEGI